MKLETLKAWVKLLVFRTIGLTLFLVIPSFVVAALNMKGILETRNQVFVGMVIGAIAFFGYIIWAQRAHYRDILGKKLPYYAMLIPLGLIAVATVVMYMGARSIYVWMFCETKIFNVFRSRISVKLSIVIFYFIASLVTCFAHIGLKQEAKNIRTAMREEAEVLGPEKTVDVEAEYDPGEEAEADEEYEKHYKKFK